jgi:hypothetical protein
MVFLPDDGSKVEAGSLGSAGVADMGSGKTRYFKAADVAAGTNYKLGLSNITAAVSAPAKSPVARFGASAGIAKMVAGIGGLAIFLVGGFLVMFKAPRAHKA